MLIKSLPLMLLSSALLSACITPLNKKPTNGTVQSQIAVLENNLANRFDKSCSENINGLKSEIRALKRAELATKKVAQCKSTPPPQPSSEIGDKLLIGEIEEITLINEQVNLQARIDSGAVTSSIGVYNLKNFERDGKKWVRFNLTDKKNAPTYEYPVYDTVTIKQTSELSEQRIEIKIDIKIGNSTYRSQAFNLADRSHLDFQLLIGRSFLRDTAVIDVGHKFLLKAR